MRRPRLKALQSSPQAYYYCVSRVVGREFLLGDAEKEQFVRYMRLYEKLYGLRILSYVVMSNHFHILIGKGPHWKGSGIGKGLDL